jgi:arylsulfatase A-like enzyme
MEAFQREGYSTGGFHSNPKLSGVFGWDRGWDELYTSLERETEFDAKSRVESILKRLNLLQIAKDFKQTVFGLPTELPYEPADKITEKALGWVKSTKKPFFLWVHYMDTHPSHFKPPGKIPEEVMKLNKKAQKKPNEITREEKEKLIEFYDSEISFVDKHIAKLINSVEKKSDAIVITADHGEEFGEHGEFWHRPKLYTEHLLVPLILISNKRKAIIDKPISLIDLSPTILDLAELDMPTSFDGVSLLPLIDGDTDYRVSPVIAEVAHREGQVRDIDLRSRKTSVRTDKWNYINIENGEDELYDLENDPFEKNNVINSNRETAEKFNSTIKKRTGGYSCP